jgi:hypothetical protein
MNLMDDSCGQAGRHWASRYPDQDAPNAPDRQM